MWLKDWLTAILAITLLLLVDWAIVYGVLQAINFLLLHQ